MSTGHSQELSLWLLSSQVISNMQSDLKIWEYTVHKYSNGLLVFNEAKSPFTKEPLTAIAQRNPAAKKITEEIKVYNEEDLLEIAEDKVKELYLKLKAATTNLGTDVESDLPKCILHLDVRRDLQVLLY